MIYNEKVNIFLSTTFSWVNNYIIAFFYSTLHITAMYIAYFYYICHKYI